MPEQDHKITVRRVGIPSHLRTFGDVPYRVASAARVYIDGTATDYLSVDCHAPGFRTVIDDDGRMLTSWHIGISSGDLARLVMPRVLDAF